MIIQGKPKRILLVENNPIVSKPVSLCLESSGYEVVVARTPSEAERCLKEQIIHVMIIDKRLGDDHDPDDTLGFTLASKRPSNIPFIVMTAYGEDESIHRAWKELKASDFINKSDPQAIEKLIASLKSVFESLNSNFELQILSEPPLELIAQKIELPKSNEIHPATASDLERILQALFYQADQVQMKQLMTNEANPSISRGGSLLMLAKQHRLEGWCPYVVVKFAWANEIEEEGRKYGILTPLLGGQRIPRLRETEIAYSHDMGGLVYSLVSEDDLGNIAPFSTFYQNRKAEQIIRLLEPFFRITFGELYKDASRTMINLSEKYAAQLHLTPAKLVFAIKTLRGEGYNLPLLKFEGIPEQMPNPVTWALAETGFRSMDRLVRHCLCHGDLHGKNMLVDKQGYVWLIDFARVDDSHALRDFVELETDIKFNLLKENDLATLFKMERALLEPDRFNQPYPVLRSVDPNTQKAYQVICNLRQVAGSLIQMEGEMREYYEALFIHTLNILRLKHILPKKKEHALMAASLACQRLDKWNPLSESDLVPTVIEPIDRVNQAGQLSQSKSKHHNFPEIKPNIPQLEWPNLAKISLVIFLLILFIVTLLWASQTFQADWTTMVAVIFLFIVLVILLLTLTGLISGKEALQSLEKLALRFIDKFSPQTKDHSNEDKEIDKNDLTPRSN